MPPRGWKKNAAGEWYDPEAKPGSAAAAGSEDVAASEPEVPAHEEHAAPAPKGEEPKAKVSRERGQLSLTKVPSKQRKFAKGN